MRIGLNVPDQQSLLTEQTRKSSTDATSQSGATPVGDKPGLSQDKITLSTLSTQVLSQPEVRQNLVDSLRQSVNSGSYNVDPTEIAKSILG
jgi:flagellar biosynthesis anti-sigma factor FlgM